MNAYPHEHYDPLDFTDNERYKLLDYTDDYGLVGRYSTLEDAQEAAEAWWDDTDGDCELVIYEWDDEIQAYVPIEENED